MTWAFRRQLFYVGILVVFFAGVGFLIAYPYFNKPPTCTDGKQNGLETGIDCGGTCPRACLVEVDKISILWSRVFRVVPGRYNAVAYLENHNENTAVYKIKYKFRFADENNLYIGKREGETYVPPAGKFAVFEPALDFGNSVPVYTSFEFIETPVWVKVDPAKVEALKLSSSNITLNEEGDRPSLSAVIKNNSLFNIPELGVVAILYDKFGNAVTASRTLVDVLRAEESTTVNFTWPEVFGTTVVTKEILPMYNIFSVKIK